ncbi:ATP-binding protein [Sorangium sp. So ce1024]|uniref:sensor histidine kinase n=1 Tax=Sorangium sp. So ce1024 TaxID=3133327 RepID=UPI003F02E0A5
MMQGDVTSTSAQDRLPGATGEPASTAAQLADAVAEASAALAGKLDPHELHHAIVALAARLLGADVALLHGAPADEAPPIRLLASCGPAGEAPSEHAAALDDLPGGPSLGRLAAESRRVELATADAADRARFHDVRALEACLGPCWVLCVPLLGQGRPLGVLTCASGSPGAPPPELLPRARALGALFGLALQRSPQPDERDAAARAERRPRDALDDAPDARSPDARSPALQRAEALLLDARAALREAEDRLAAERRWLRSVIEDFPVAIAVFDERGGGTLLASRRCEQLCGGPHPLKAFELPEGSPHARLCAPGGRPLDIHEMPLVRAARGQGTTCEELWFCRPDGRYVPVVVSAGPIGDDQGAILGAIASYEDVTHYAERARLREEWTSIVAHDLKQPLSAISAYAGMLSRRVEAADAAGWSQKILASARRLERMIEDLLDASKIEARRLSIERRPTDLGAHLRAAVELAIAERPDRAVVLAVDEGVPPVLMDPARMDQVIGNLLLNAAKYGDPSAPIRVTLARRSAEVEVAIENRGRGIPPDELPRLFQRFQRLSSGQSSKATNGTGLGLYICKGIVEAHGGRIWARSTLNETTSFHFTLPLPGASGS